MPAPIYLFAGLPVLCRIIYELMPLPGSSGLRAVSRGRSPSARAPASADLGGLTASPFSIVVPALPTRTPTTT